MNENKRCAIYTRKSVDEGLDAEFNTLEAQRKYCEAYIANQPGWHLLPERYDDGGYSGGTMNRPAMKRLLADVDAGKVDVIVAYKIDRLSRSIVDFANLSAYLESKGVSFVLVTQNVDTTTSMGRMQLNLLMTFAQFEREMSSDRIRDKVRLMRQRGMWTGGHNPYGYLSQDRHLVIIPAEAAVVRRIFDDYIRLGSPITIARTLNREGVIYRDQKPWTVKTIQRLLHNPIYVGKVTHNQDIYDGEHDPIVTPKQWEQVQNTRGIRIPLLAMEKPNEVSLLQGKLVCGTCGHTMHHEIHQRDTRIYRYYICRRQSTGELPDNRCKVRRLPAAPLEREVFAILQTELTNAKVAAEVGRLLESTDPTDILQRLDVPELREILTPTECNRFIELLIRKVEVNEEGLKLTLNGEALTGNKEAHDLVKTIPLRCIHASARINLTVENRETVLTPEVVSILMAIQTARKWKRWLVNGTVRSLYSLSKRLNYDKRYIQRRFRLAFLSPRIILALMNQNITTPLSLAKLGAIATLPWPEQEKSLGLS